MGFWNFVKERKAWIIGPIVLFLLAMGAILLGSRGSALAPFVYSVF